MSDHLNDSPHVTPPIADLTGRETPTPGPLTKPVAIPRALRRRRPRWVVVVIVLVALAAVAAGIIWWASVGASAGEATAPLAEAFAGAYVTQ
ncbi:hypothetical protein DC31_07020 [Microbacterium sp. CH12i]|uniref:hypothetical protein n=1 Tax=Microbacterium sp. CH12i TaxID=1479651 RepID=UPI000460B8DB|nr:hypothetical protein [Microbacterium sp. CH12i]KDA06915.1 hypothetical protein DC31_07020 [Microbacterium sp. CH12i]